MNYDLCLLTTILLLGLSVTNGLAQTYNRYLRSCNIREKGWPPAHLDADGDFKSESDS